MTTDTALAEIAGFWNGEPLPFGLQKHGRDISRASDGFDRSFPDELNAYISNRAPAEDFYFDTVGNPMRIYSIDNLKFRQDGYNYNPLKNEPIEGWPAGYFIIADEGADPVIIDLEHPETGIQKLTHGAGSWDYGESVADTIGQFLLCSAAQHHALNAFEEETIIDDERGFNLAPDAAAWYFSRMKTWAGEYYEAWCSVFDNS